MTPYNPLDKLQLAQSVVQALLDRPAESLPPTQAFEGAGIYAIYYRGPFAPYARIARGRREAPIYVGKAVPPGARKGGFGLGETPGNALYRRLREHAHSLDETENLCSADFLCRYLVVDDIWIPLGEQLLIERFAPLWNKKVDGFGIHDPGKGRGLQQRSLWDMLHPGRAIAARLPENTRTVQEIRKDIAAFLEERFPG